jgi:hypothetical protein
MSLPPRSGMYKGGCFKNTAHLASPGLAGLGLNHDGPVAAFLIFAISSTTAPLINNSVNG